MSSLKKCFFGPAAFPNNNGVHIDPSAVYRSEKALEWYPCSLCDPELLLPLQVPIGSQEKQNKNNISLIRL